MSNDGLPRVLGLFSLLPAALLAATAGPTAQAPASTSGEVTFTRDIAPILQRSCQECHHADGVAPMSLVTYDEVRPWARAMKTRPLSVCAKNRTEPSTRTAFAPLP